jgi:diguanylate cyclase (GGDEF)-like protein
MKADTIDVKLFFGILISYACFFICTLVGGDFWIRLLGLVTEALIFVTIISCLKPMGRYWVPSFVLDLGVLGYMIADILIFLERFILHTNSLSTVASYIYLLPNGFFGLSVGLYFIQKLKGRDLYQFLLNSLALTSVGFVLFESYITKLKSYPLLSKDSLIQLYLYFFINFFILIMIGHMIYMIATETGLKGTNTMILGIIGYILMDTPYNFTQALGNDPENKYFDLVYMLCMLLMAHGICHQIHHHHVFKLRSYVYNEASVKRTRFLVLIGIALTTLFWALGFFDVREASFIVVVLLAYWITRATFQNSSLNEQLLKQQDILTGLYNRRYITTVLDESVEKADETNGRFAIFCIDLNNFKPINDTYGHDMGDRVLKEYGSRMLALPSSYISFRTGGDEFVIIKNKLEEHEDLTVSAKMLQKLFHDPIHLDTYTLNLSGSIGIASYPDDSTEPELLLRYADAAMYSVKHSNLKDNYRFYDSSLIEIVNSHKDLVEKLKNADPAKDFCLHFQPRVDALTGKVTIAEVFPRLKDNDSVTAADLIPIAENVGLMNRLGLWIADNALEHLKKWQEDYGSDLSISINLSPLQLLDKQFLESLKELPKEYDIDVSNIQLEISNEAIMGASLTAKETLKELSDHGFILTLNNFGGDDINLFHILICGFSAILLSPSLINKSDNDNIAMTLVNSIIALADTMKVSVYAVGVETKEQEEKLVNLGVRALQGYYYGKPQDATEFENRYLKKG